MKWIAGMWERSERYLVYFSIGFEVSFFLIYEEYLFQYVHLTGVSMTRKHSELELNLIYEASFHGELQN